VFAVVRLAAYLTTLAWGLKRWRDQRRARKYGVQMPASLMGSQVFQIKFDYQTALELFHQEDNGSIRVHLDLVIFSPFVLG
jgi:hypothetical protein